MKLVEEKALAIKTATRLLITRVGGLEAAASVCRLAASALSECSSRNHLERMLPLDVALQLEEVAGEPIVTAALARIQGRSLASPDPGAVPAVANAVGAVVAQAGALAAQLIAAQADGHVCEVERAQMRGVAEQVRDAAEATLAGLSGPALRVVA